MTAQERSNVRQPLRRWVVTGLLKLETAAHFGGPNEDDCVDMVLHRDAATGKFLLTGASLAGALRSALEDLHFGYWQTGPYRSQSLFGGSRQDDEGDQSPLLVFDSLCSTMISALRDGVAIDPVTGIAEDKAKFDYEIIPAGALFPVRFDLLVDRNGPPEDFLLAELTSALSLLEQGEVPLGARKARGLGQCSVSGWKIGRFDLTTRSGYEAWLKADAKDPLAAFSPHQTLSAAVGKAGIKAASFAQDQRDSFCVGFDVAIDGSLLIRSAGSRASDPDMSHLSEGGRPLVPGTSLGGVFRSHAARILRSLGIAESQAQSLVQGMFGTERKNTDPVKNRASRLRIRETFIQGQPQELVVSRIRCDRFTGGVVDSALFDQKPIFGGNFRIVVRLLAPRPHEQGLLLLILKDLLDGVVNVGGEGSVGRGCLRPVGLIEFLDIKRGHCDTWQWQFDQSAEPALQQRLNGMVEALHSHLAQEVAS